jgi:hypothetical protein
MGMDREPLTETSVRIGQQKLAAERRKVSTRLSIRSGMGMSKDHNRDSHKKDKDKVKKQHKDKKD